MLELTGCEGLLESTVRISTESTKLLELTGRARVLELTGRSSLSELTGHIILLKLTESTSLRASIGCTDWLKLTGLTNLRPSTVHIELLKSTGRTGLEELAERLGSLKLKEHICLLGLTGDKSLQTLTGHTLIIKERIYRQLLKMILL